MPTTKATAQWKGSIAKGSGTMSVSGNSFEYNVPSRFEDAESSISNPEELLGAAHAGCYSMALSAALTRAGFEVRQIDTTAKVNIAKGSDGWDIDRIELTVKADVAEIDEATFLEHARGAKTGCPVSKALAGVPTITLDAKLV